MGMYTGLRFKGIIKKQYRREISIMFNKGDWESCETPILKEFSKKSRSSWIPFGSSCDYMPDSWTENDDGFECNFDESSGWFSFACALKRIRYNNKEERKVLQTVKVIGILIIILTLFRRSIHIFIIH